MLDFEKAHEYAQHLSKEEEQDMLKTALKETGIPFEELNGQVIVRRLETSCQRKKRDVSSFRVGNPFTSQSARRNKNRMERTSLRRGRASVKHYKIHAK